MERLLGGKLYKAKSLTELATVERDIHLDRNGGLPHREKFDAAVCQCCGVRENPNKEPCVCDGVAWFLMPGGRVECLPHRTARAISGNRRNVFDMLRRK